MTKFPQEWESEVGGKEEMEGGIDGHQKNEKKGERSVDLAEELANRVKTIKIVTLPQNRFT